MRGSLRRLDALLLVDAERLLSNYGRLDIVLDVCFRYLFLAFFFDFTTEVLVQRLQLLRQLQLLPARLIAVVIIGQQIMQVLLARRALLHVFVGTGPQRL